MKLVATAPPPLPNLQALSALAPELASTFVSVAADIALVIDADGVIKHVSVGADPLLAGTGKWLGQPWVDTVTGDTKRKIELLLAEARTSGVTRRREVNHPSQESTDVPVAYSAIRLGQDGPVLAVGRDLRAVAAIQQRFVQATQAMERDYWSQRQAEAQVRTLYQVGTDAVLVVDALTLQVVQANAAAHALLSPRLDGGLEGTLVTARVLAAEQPGFSELLATARTSGRPGMMRAHAAPASPGQACAAVVSVEISATPLRSGPRMLLMVQMRRTDAETDAADASRRRSAWVDAQTDALVVTDSSGRVLMCNPAFAALCRVADGATAQRRTLAELLGDPAHEMAPVLLRARREGLAHASQVFVGHPAPNAGPGDSTHRPSNSASVDISAMLLAEGDQERIGLRLHKPKAAAGAAAAPLDQLALGIGHLADQVGLLALPQLLQQAVLLAERHLVATALARSHGRLHEAAVLLDVPVPTLQARMQHLELTAAGQGVDTLEDPTPQHPGPTA